MRVSIIKTLKTKCCWCYIKISGQIFYHNDSKYCFPFSFFLKVTCNMFLFYYVSKRVSYFCVLDCIFLPYFLSSGMNGEQVIVWFAWLGPFWTKLFNDKVVLKKRPAKWVTQKLCPSLLVFCRFPLALSISLKVFRKTVGTEKYFFFCV